MPTKPKTPCCWRSIPPCPKLTADRFCEEHAAEHEKRRQKEVDVRRRNNPNRKKYSRKQWRDLRLMVLNAEPLCRECLKNGTVSSATEVDHIVPIARGGDDSFSNLQPLCHSCHSRKTCSDDGGFGIAKQKD